MNRHTGGHCALAAWLLGPVLLVPDTGVAAAAAPTEQAPPSDKELGEVLIEGLKPERDPQKVINWLAHLVGEFTYEGHVDVHAQGNPEDTRPVRGSGSCVGYGPRRMRSRSTCASTWRSITAGRRERPGSRSSRAKAAALNYDQVTRSSKIKGVADCAAVGGGPGVRCMIDATWQPMFFIQVPERASGSDSTLASKFTLHPSIFLFGLHPEAAAIRVLEVDDHSIAVAATEVFLEDNNGVPDHVPGHQPSSLLPTGASDREARK